MYVLKSGICMYIIRVIIIICVFGYLHIDVCLHTYMWVHVHLHTMCVCVHVYVCVYVRGCVCFSNACTRAENASPWTYGTVFAVAPSSPRTCLEVLLRLRLLLPVQELTLNNLRDSLDVGQIREGARHRVSHSRR